MSARRRRLNSIIAGRLMLIAVAVIVVNGAIVLYRDATDRQSLLSDLLQRELLRLEGAAIVARGDMDRLRERAGPIYVEHPEAMAYAVFDAGGGLIGGMNTGLFSPETLVPVIFADDWLAWRDEPGQFPVVASHRVTAIDEPVTIMLLMLEDPAGLVNIEILDEFLGHVALPLLPIAVLLIGGTLLMIRRALVPVGEAADWARRTRPGEPLPAFERGDLPAEIADLTDAVRRSVDRLNDELAAEQRRAGEAAHALRTPVAVLVARLDSLPGGPEYDRVRDDVQALSRIVTQYLSASGADRLELRPGETAELGAIAEEVVADLWPLARERDSEIELVPAPAPCEVFGSTDAIALALTNLVENAILHGRGAPIAVTVGPGPELVVRDHGPGLPAGPRAALFEPFRRGPGALRGGAGLGLAIVDRIQRAHGGSVEAADAPGGGALFRLSYLPA